MLTQLLMRTHMHRYTGFMRVPGLNNQTMPEALPATVQTGGMGGGNNPQAV